MRISNELGLTNVDMSVASTNGPAIYMANNLSFSIQSVSTGVGVGTIKVQVSDDMPIGSSTEPTNWSDLPSATIAVTAASTLILAKTEICYQYMRLVFTKTSGTGTLNARIKSIGF